MRFSRVVWLIAAPWLSACAVIINPGADRPISPVAESALVGIRERAIATRARSLDVPDLDDPERVLAGAGNYEAMCAGCHLAPGREPGELQHGMQPPPPDLARMTGMDPAEAFWTIKHGIKMTGMPAWGVSMDDDTIWGLTAFVQKLPSLSEHDYADLVARSPGHQHGHDEHADPAVAEHDDHAAMDHAPMSLLERMMMRDASGTAWQPETTPMHGAYGEAGPVRWMGHASVFGMYDVQGKPRGDRQFASVNWAMGSAWVGDHDSQVGARAMVSLEPLTVGGAGYPLLGQTGETWRGRRLIDHQHPHDLFMELALAGRQTFGDIGGVELYVAPVGEPALGPAAFAHRASAISDPFAPIGHHWEDATHISFGVLTAGVFNEWAKLEGSWFNGREPDEGRYDLDLAVPDSWSSRLSVSLMPMLTAQVSYGWLAEPEPLEPGVSVTRTTASMTFDHDGAGNGNWATTAGWGRNASDGERSDALLLESDVGIGNNNVYGRAEYVVKSADELLVASLAPDVHLGLTSLALGDVYSVKAGAWRAGIGVRGNVLIVPRSLAPTYGGRAPVGAAVYVQLRPGEAKMTRGPSARPE